MTTEKELLELMISIYENDHHQDLSKLKEYAFKRIDCCPRKKEKTFCSQSVALLMGHSQVSQTSGR